MIPKQLTLKGIYSYQEEQSIDFDNLVAGQLFGIFGSVGSGKSTILEAISFALYGETERLNQRENRNYNMMNLKSDELLVDFVFLAGNEQKEFRFTVTGKRNSKRFDDVRTFDRRAYQKKDGEWEPLEHTNAKEIIGLSYDNFRRTIIIPQGKFQEFLQMGDTERTKMLKEIFQLNKFDLFNQVRALELKNIEKRENINGSLSQLGDAGKDSIREKDSQLALMVKAAKKAENLFREKKQEEKEQDKLKELFDKLTEHKALLDQLTSLEQQYREREKQLSAYEYCLLHFKGLLERKTELDREIQSGNKSIQDISNNIEAITGKLKKKNKEFQQVKIEYRQRDQYRIQKEELKQILEIKKLNVEISELKARLEKGDEFVKKNALEFDQTSHQCNELRELLKEKKTGLPDEQIIAEVQSWFTNKVHFSRNLLNAENEFNGLKNDLAKLEDDKTSLLKPELLEITGSGINKMKISGIITSLNDAVEERKSSYDQLNREEKEWLAKEKLEEIALELKDGNPCPVCGSTEHPQVLSMKNVKEKQADIRKQQNKLKDEITLLETAIRGFERLKYQSEEKQNVLHRLTTDLQHQKQILQEHHKQFIWKEYSPEDDTSLKEDTEKAIKLRKEIESKEKELEDLQEKLEKQRKLKEDAIDRIAILKEEHQTKKSRSGTLLEQVRTLQFEDYLEIDDTEIQKQIKNLEQKIANVDKEFEKLENEIKGLNDEERTLTGQLSSLQNQLMKDQQNLLEIQEKIRIELDKSGFATEDEVAHILSNEIELDSEKKEINEYRQKLHTAKETYKSLQEQIKDKDFDQEKYEHLKEEVTKLETESEDRKMQVVRMEEALKKMKEEWKKKKELQKEKEKLEERAENITTLKKLFKGNGFVNYISSVYLENLCKAANERFYKLTRQKLQLEMTENNSFQVRDFLNNGQVRSAKTLSGGQTFQASLSLALALADSIHKQNKAEENFFFLDEGFGSQDKESLQLVFDTLKSLRKENRIIGIISHVEELQQEIDVYLHIKNDEEKGSRIKESWGS